jgi:hypothetical protein
MSDMTISIKTPAHRDSKGFFNLTVFRFGKIEVQECFASEKETRSYLRRCGYPSTKAEVQLS